MINEKNIPSSQEETARQQSFIQLAKALTEQKIKTLGRPLTYCLTTFGCQMNEKQSEAVAGIMDEIGYVRQENEEADVVIYNTCTVRENANLKVYGRLGHLHSLKDKNPDMKIILFGCMMQEAHVVEKIKKTYSFVNLVFGTHNIFKFAELFYEMLLSDMQLIDIWEGTDQIVEDLPTERNYTFKSGVNIMFGCNNFCSYCIVPYVRGRERSRKPEAIIKEIKNLVADGVSEVMLLGQNVNSYGKTLETPVTFAQLLTMLEDIEGLRRIRFMTSHPKDLSDELIEVMAKSKKICHHLHLPLQSGSSRILKEMNRRYDKEKYLNLVENIRTAIPDISLTTDIIVGFPGETEEDFQETLDVVRQAGYDTAFTFIYSKRTGTPAAAKEDQVPEDVVKDRFNRLLTLVQEQGRIRSSRFEGTVQEVLVEEESKEKGIFTGRTQYNLLVHFPADESLLGTYVKVKLEECKGFYYLGSLSE
ncbi:tRNA (N6-isopentenyl adenosine(37)-C2)-methylthiotransferase MiaB [Blautia sp.]|uniref:tRNA (N6-isopentenyl adenosine(37)-C2)-methylthiotransferase MiaB n=1 Tax=Blautia sp. TaxID=1955243 RepID=UPI00280B2E85|nr:tRNA (N6-isopentenyl adenosine(37)-C2)-methylthiotransferase MiaB [Blautia sp.]MED9882466.1 tRNA (N6-isopentenyl adenosine(37)-C2)-methylthiotransferase MiaB [Blautia sp.]